MTRPDATLDQLRTLIDLATCRLMHGAWRRKDGPGNRWCWKCGCAR